MISINIYWKCLFLGFQMLNSQVTTAQHMERERAYDVVSIISALYTHLWNISFIGYSFLSVSRLPR